MIDMEIIFCLILWVVGYYVTGVLVKEQNWFKIFTDLVIWPLSLIKELMK